MEAAPPINATEVVAAALTDAGGARDARFLELELEIGDRLVFLTDG